MKRLVIALGFTQLLGWGSTFYLPATLGDAMAASLSLPREVIVGGVTMMVIASAIASPAVGRIADRGGARVLLAGGSLLLAAGLLVLSQAQGLAGFIVAWLLLGLGGALALSVTPNVALIQVAGDNARAGVAALSLTVGMTSTVCFPVTAWMAGEIGWRGACLVFAAVQLLVALPLHLWVAPRREAVRPMQQARRGEVTLARPMLAFGLLAATYSLFSLLSWGIPIQMIPLFEDMGMGPVTAVAVAALFGPAQVASRIGDLVFGRRIRVTTLGIASAVLMPLAFLPALIAPGTMSAILLAVLYGLGAGTLTVARAILPMLLFGREAYGMWLGRLAVPTQIASAISPVLLAAAFGAGANVLLWLCLAVSLGLLGCMIALARRVPE